MHDQRDIIRMVLNLAFFILALLLISVLAGCKSHCACVCEPSPYIPPLTEERLTAENGFDADFSGGRRVSMRKDRMTE